MGSDQAWEDYDHPDKPAEEDSNLVAAGTAYFRVPGATCQAKTWENCRTKVQLCSARILLAASGSGCDVFADQWLNSARCQIRGLGQDIVSLSCVILSLRLLVWARISEALMFVYVLDGVSSIGVGTTTIHDMLA